MTPIIIDKNIINITIPIINHIFLYHGISFFLPGLPGLSGLEGFGGGFGEGFGEGFGGTSGIAQTFESLLLQFETQFAITTSPTFVGLRNTVPSIC